MPVQRIGGRNRMRGMNPRLSPDATVAMTNTVENLILDLVEWVERRERTYEETMEAWRTSCPRLHVWEDATDRGLVEVASVNDRSLVRATLAGLTVLREKRPSVYEALHVERPRETTYASDDDSSSSTSAGAGMCTSDRKVR